MSSHINFAVAQAHQQDLLRAAEKSRIAPAVPRRRFSALGGVLRSVTRDRSNRELATAPKVAAAHGA